MKKKSIYLPQFTIGEEAFAAFPEEMHRFGRTVAVVHGEKAWAAAGDSVREAIKSGGMELVSTLCYGKEATVENAENIAALLKEVSFDLILAVGGGKCIDTVKYAADLLEKPVFTVPTIASNCAAVTKISILYHEDGSFREVVKLKFPPVHCFISTPLAISAPLKYFWAGMGDAMAKHVESSWSAKAGEPLDYGTELGIVSSRMCFAPMIREGEEAYQDAREGKLTAALENTILNIVVSPGVTSLAVHPNYNGGIAHALFYGLTQREVIEKHHLHGEVVSYGTLVNLLVDQDLEKLKAAYAFNKAVKLPVCLADLDLDPQDPLEDVLEATMANPELSHIPYPVSKSTIYEAMMELENYRG